jgi:hypothetical protein
MKLFNPTDIYGAIKPLYYTSNILGLAPFTGGNNKAVTEILSRLWSAVMVTLQVAGMVFGMLQVGFVQHNEGTEPSYIVTIMLVIFLMHATSVTVTVLGATIYRNNLSKILTKIKQIDNVLFPLKIRRDVAYKKTFRILVIELVILAVISTSVYAYYRCFMGTYIPIIPILFDTLSDVTNTVMDVIIFNVVVLLTHRCREVKIQLKKQLSALPDVHFDTQSINVHLHSSCGLSTVEERSYSNGQRMLLTLRHAPSVTCDKADKIHKLREVYSHLHDISELLNTTYGFSLLLDIAYNFTNTIVCVYFALRDMVSMLSDASVANGFVQMTSWLIWGVANLGKMVIMTSLCHYASLEAQGLSVVVQKLLLSQLLRHEVKTELQFFATQLAQSKLQFTAFGFFYVDFSLLCAMIGSATTYIIVLVQFRGNSPLKKAANLTNTT